MRAFSSPVKHPLATALARVGINTLWAVAYYHGVPHSHDRSKTQLVERLQAVFLAPDLAARLDPLLTHHDRALYAQLCAGHPSSVPVAAIRFPWRWAGDWPALATLRPLERLMALGLVLPIHHPATVDLILPEELIPAVLAPPAAAVSRPPLPPVPALTALLEDAVTALATLARQAVRHTAQAAWPLPLRRQLLRYSCAAGLAPPIQRARLRRIHTLLHQAGLLNGTAAGCTPSLTVPTFLDCSATDQLNTLLAAWSTQPLLAEEWPPDLPPTDLPGPALWTTWLLPRLRALGPQRTRLDRLLADWLADGTLLHPPLLTRPPGAAPLPPDTASRLLLALLRGPLPQFGLLQLDATDLALTPAGHAWLQGTLDPTAPTAAPHLDDCTLRLPLPAPPALRFQLTPWAEHHASGPQGHVYAFTPASVRQGRALFGTLTPLRAVLTRWFPDLSPSLQTLLAAAEQPAPLRLGTAPLLQAADSATLTSLLARRAVRRRLSRRLGPRAALVRDEAPLRRLLERDGLLDPAPAPLTPPAPPLPAARLVLALRLAAQAAPAYTPLFTPLATSLVLQLSDADRAELDDLWFGLEPPEAEAAPGGADDRISALAPATVRAALRAAIEQGTPLRIRYHSATRNRVGWRTIRPLILHPPYLTAFCQRAADERLFRLDRILALTPADATDGSIPPTTAAPPVPPPPAAPTPGAFLAPDLPTPAD